MKKSLVAIFAVLACLTLPAQVLTGEQHGEFKFSYRVVVDGVKGTIQRLPVEAGHPVRSIADMPEIGLKGVRFVPSGDQHLAVVDAGGKALCYYHLVTGTWAEASAMKPPRRFGWVSWGVVGLYFLVVAGMAAWFLRKGRTAESYFRGGGKIPWYVAGMSIFATILSSITFLASPAQYYLNDWSYAFMVVGAPLSVPIVVAFYLPVFRRLRLTSAYEYLERRFNGSVRSFASLIYVLFVIARVAIVTLLPALALNSMTGVQIDVCIAVCGAVTVLYCALGGLEAVVWSDFVQGCVLVLGAFAIVFSLWSGTSEGALAAASTAFEHGKFRLADLRLVCTEPVLWVLVVVGFFETFGTMTSDQCVIQRYGVVKDVGAATRSMWFNCALAVGTTVLFALMGTGLWVYYHAHPTFLNPALPKADSILPCFIVNEMHPALAGLVVAAIFAATISTLSANLSGVASSMTADFVLRVRPGLSPRAQVRWGQALTVLAGVLGTAFSLVLSRVETHALFDTFKEVVTMMMSGLAGLFFIGVFLRRVRGRAALAGLVVNYAVCLVLRYAAVPFDRPHVFLVGAIGFVMCVVSACVFSFAIPDRRKDLRGLVWDGNGSDAYEQGGYESATSPFGPSVADDLIGGAIELLTKLK